MQSWLPLRIVRGPTATFVRISQARTGRSRRGTSRSGARRTPPPSQARGTGAFLAGLACGLFVAFLVYLTGWLPSRDPAAPDTAASGTTPEPPPGVRFEFPDVLPESEVLVPYVEEYLQPEKAPEQAVDYLLQAGAFRDAGDADRRRATILLLDLDARTATAQHGGRTWHRVLVGPFPDRDQVRQAQLRLLEEEIDSIVLEVAEPAGEGA